MYNFKVSSIKAQCNERRYLCELHGFTIALIIALCGKKHVYFNAMSNIKRCFSSRLHILIQFVLVRFLTARLVVLFVLLFMYLSMKD